MTRCGNGAHGTARTAAARPGARAAATGEPPPTTRGVPSPRGAPGLGGEAPPLGARRPRVRTCATVSPPQGRP
eukprot:1522312-Prymnesium_polylepis.1